MASVVPRHATACREKRRCLKAGEMMLGVTILLLRKKWACLSLCLSAHSCQLWLSFLWCWSEERMYQHASGLGWYHSAVITPGDVRSPPSNLDGQSGTFCFFRETALLDISGRVSRCNSQLWGRQESRRGRMMAYPHRWRGDGERGCGLGFKNRK